MFSQQMVLYLNIYILQHMQCIHLIYKKYEWPVFLFCVSLGWNSIVNGWKTKFLLFHANSLEFLADVAPVHYACGRCIDLRFFWKVPLRAWSGFVVFFYCSAVCRELVWKWFLFTIVFLSLLSVSYAQNVHFPPYSMKIYTNYAVNKMYE